MEVILLCKPESKYPYRLYMRDQGIRLSYLTKKGIQSVDCSWDAIGHPDFCMKTRREALGVLKNHYNTKLIEIKEYLDRSPEEYYKCSPKGKQ